MTRRRERARDVGKRRRRAPAPAPRAEGRRGGATAALCFWAVVLVIGTVYLAGHLEGPTGLARWLVSLLRAIVLGEA